jgi:hypothetical protein
MYRMWIKLFSSIDPDPESGFAIKLEAEFLHILGTVSFSNVPKFLSFFKV